MARSTQRPKKRAQPDPPPVDPGLERAAMLGILAGVALSTGVNVLLREWLALPYVGLFGTYFLAAFGGYFAWRMVLLHQFAPMGTAREAVGLWCALIAVGAGAVFTLAVGVLGLVMNDGPAANVAALPLVVIAFIVMRRWLAERNRQRRDE